MTEPQSGGPAGGEALVKPQRRLGLVWLIPLVAAAIGAYLAYDAISSRGPTITITFETAEGLTAGKTKLRYRDVDVGTVDSIAISKDLSHVIVTCSVMKAHDEHLNEDTRFWVVRPRIGAGGISGLGTLVSGAYIAVAPGTTEGKRMLHFTGLENPPIESDEAPGLKLVLHADALRGVDVGSPLLYRQTHVGAVERHKLADDGRSVEINAYIQPEYQHLVASNSLFWNASGVAVKAGLGGVDIQTESFAALLAGGIAFDTPDEGENTPRAESGARFELLASREKAVQARERREGLNITVEARDGSIAEGAPVTYRKHRVGHVGASELSPDATSVRYQVHFDSRYAPLVRRNSRFWNASGVRMHVGLDGLNLETDSVESILEGGLEFATPSSPGPPAESGALYALHDAPAKQWLAWAPKIWLGPEGEARTLAHALPPASKRPRGLKIVLESFTSGSVKRGDPIYYREVKVGEIGEHELSPDAKTVRIHARIEPRYATLVRDNSRFWNASGISAHLGLSGLDVRTESLESMMEGGVAFATPDQPGAPVKPGTLFPLHPKAEDAWQRWSPGIPIDGPSGGTVEHAIHVETHGHLLRRSPKVEAVAPDAGGEPAGAASPPKQDDSGPLGFFRRLFGGEDASTD